MLSNSSSNTIAFILLGLMFVLTFFSARGDSATFDEHAHIPAGYSYLTLKDYRLNPEHPPLMKDLSALPLLFLNVKFPTEAPSWKDAVNGQWDTGRLFLYGLGNNADRMLFWARLPVMFLALFFGWFLFNTARNLYGNKVGLLALFFFVTSPTIIAHSRYVTTDVGAAFGFFLGLITFHKFLEKNDFKSLVFAGICLGIALLIKFSTFLLIPLYMLFGFLWVFLARFDYLKSLGSFKSRFIHLIKEEGKMALRLMLIFLIALSIVLVVYQYHVWNYPPERQVKDTQTVLPSVAQKPMDKLKKTMQEIQGLESFGIKPLDRVQQVTKEAAIAESFGIKPLVKADIWLADKPVLRGFGQYLLGLIMTRLRAGFSWEKTYYWGEVSDSSWKSYFPMAYLLKEQLAFHVITFSALIISISLPFFRHKNNRTSFTELARSNYVLTMSFIFIGIYWLISILSPLNIGIRHVLPTLPFIYFLVAYFLVRGLYSIYERLFKPAYKYIFVGGVLLWLLVEIILVYPFYLSYYNVIAVGSDNGWRFIVDSNYDWGQDLKRLKQYIDQNNIDKIRLDYFGNAGAPRYYLEEKFEPWWSAKGEPYGWFAISATMRQHAFGRPVNRFKINRTDSYSWLKQYEPVARAGKSIFIYNIE